MGAEQQQLKLSRFDLRRELGRGGMGVVYEAYDHETDSVIALKALRQFDADALLRFKNEFRALADLHHPNLVRFGELYCERGQWFFTMELVVGVDFMRHVRFADANVRASEREDRTQRIAVSVDAAGRAVAAPFEPVAARGYDEARLRSALRQLALGLDAVHRSGRVHRDVKPSNVLVRPDGHLLLLDFGLIDDLRGRAPVVAQPHSFSGTPAFMAPEQTQRAHVGPEADWYSFGAMLFLALTGELPFAGSPDHMIDMKQHHDGRAPGELCRDVPDDLDLLCRALLRRDPAARPSPADILRIFDAGVAATATATATPASERWVDDSVRLFVGRERERATLVDALERCRQGQSVSVAVEGEPGMGKSALVRHFLEHEVALDPGAVVLAGRCYEQEAVPFKAFDTVIDSLSVYLGELDQQAVAPLIAEGTRYLAAVFPVLRRVPALAAHGVEREVDSPLALRAQAFQELKRLLAVLAERVRLVLFIDDLQWADKDSLALLEYLIAPPDPPRLLLLVTRRADAGGSAAAELLRGFARVQLGGLSHDEAKLLWTRLWRSSSGESVGVERLERLLADTAGHPLFLSELVRDAGSADPDVTGAGTSLQAVLRRRLQRLDDSARRLMECVALAGRPIRFHVVARAAGIPVSESLTLMSSLRITQMLRVSRRGDARLVEPYHDRVREAVLERLDEDDAARAHARQLHLGLGRLLLETTSEAELPSEVFAIVQHLNRAAELLVEPAERRRAAELNLLAGRQARMATAYDAAVDYLERGLGLLGAEAWQSDYPLWSALAVERMESEYLANRRAAAEAHFDELLPRLRSEAEVADLYVSKIGLETGHGRFTDAIATGLAALPRFGVVLPERVTTASVLREYAATRLSQGRGRIAELANRPLLTDDRMHGAMKILIALGPPAFFVDTRLVSVCLMRIARLSMKHGLTDVSSYGFAGYGLVLSGAFAKHEEAHELGQLALALNERFANPRLVSKLYCLTGTFLTPWVRPFAEGQAELHRSQEAGLEHGDTNYESYSAATLAVITFCRSSDLASLQARIQASRAITARRRDQDMTGMMRTLERQTAALRGLDGTGQDLSSAESSDADFRRELSEESAPTALLYYYFCNGFLAYWLGDRDRAAPLIDEAGARIERIFSIPSTVELVLMELLVAAHRYAKASWPARLRLDWQMRRRLGKLRRWAQSCPQNFEAQYWIAVAQRASVRGDARADEHFATAVARARQHGTAMREGLALQLHAERLRARGRASEAAAREREAIDAFERWGAGALVARLRRTSAP